MQFAGEKKMHQTEGPESDTSYARLAGEEAILRAPKMGAKTGLTDGRRWSLHVTPTFVFLQTANFTVHNTSGDALDHGLARTARVAGLLLLGGDPVYCPPERRTP